MSSDSATDWCQQNKELHNVEVGKSWGTLPTDLHDKWSVLQCDQFLLRNDNDSPPTYLFLFCLSLFFTLTKLYQDTTSNNPINSQSNNPIKKNV